MIKFFRRIRRRLIDEGNLKRYLIYAVGEILLVVIGILIALSINNWNQEKLSRQKEHLVLKSLKEDFLSNQGELDSTLRSLPVDLKRLHFSSQYFGIKEDTLSKPAKESIINCPVIITDIIDGTLNSVLNTDKLELIQNDTLKQLLTRYPSQVRKFKQQEEIYIKIIIEVQRPLLEKYLSLYELPKDILSLMNLKPSVRTEKNRAQSDYIGILNDITYQNTVINRIFNTQVHLNNITVLKEHTSGILQLIERELGGL